MTSRGPNFIGIGTEKPATTWLHNILKLHPYVWMPPSKEIRFFNDNEDNSSHFKRVLLKRKRYKVSKRFFMFKHIKNLKWAYLYLFKKRNIENYLKLFQASNYQIAGEITPSYGILNENKIAEIYKKLPNTKIIYIVRNPIHRDWSSVCMNYKNVHKLPIKNRPVSEVIQRVTHPHKLKYSNYTKNLDNWQKFYKEDKIFIGFYQEIHDEPLEFLKRLFKFLDLPYIDMSILYKLLDRKINSVTKKIPKPVHKAIVESEYESILASHQRFNNKYTTIWLEEANANLNQIKL